MLEIVTTSTYVIGMRTRLPFRYGIARMTVAPHVVVRVVVEFDGGRAEGHAADHLPPKWFTKDATTTYAEDLGGLVGSVLEAADSARRLDWQATPFDLWFALYEERQVSGADLPPLLRSFGVSLVEQAVIDAFCRHHRVPFADAIRRGMLGLDLPRLQPDLAGHHLNEFLPPSPSATVLLRHTVGLDDALDASDLRGEEPCDGLPVTLQQVLVRHGIRRLKIKLSGDLATDRRRLRRIAELPCDDSLRCTLDGNENFCDVAAFRRYWEELGTSEAGSWLRPRLLAVEQPLHRDHALEPEVASALHQWPGAPPLIVDESDGELGSVRRALEAGYAGAAYKSCRGVFKGLGNAALLRRGGASGERWLLTAEDLATVGPLSLLQDLAVVASLGIADVERNGHHYFGGVAPLWPAVDDDVTRLHGDLYRASEGSARLRVEAGRLELQSITAAPFGFAGIPDLTGLPELSLLAARELIENTLDKRGSA